MAAKAWYKPSALPQLIARFDPPPAAGASKRAIEVWTTTCIVTNFGMRRDIADRTPHEDRKSPLLPSCSILINPANPNLTGPNSFPYFPRGGPQPLQQPSREAHHIMGYVSQWGGMDVGGGMLFSAEAIDGLVHQLGGLRLRAECALVPTHRYSKAYANQQTQPESKENDRENSIENGDDAKCPVGTAVITSPGGAELQKHYDAIVHTTPPFHNYPPTMAKDLKEILGIEKSSELHSWSRELLRSCYRQSFILAFGNNNSRVADKQNSFMSNPFGFLQFDKPSAQQIQRVAVPLLGSGCRDFPKDVALEVAALESASWLSNDNCQKMKDVENIVVFGLLEVEDAEELSAKLERNISLLQ
eukprot:CAMPEP_0181076506 /NCGR_PEP_ID=MMETSP1071-20121207/456_1 /TAXON_ID=35127 /ORGANISM="Thalassiosira sp., Strain NH16" /LENGTH=358 /DNA_ID=CAMNT_0023157693 /DNA_START=180 /DNA_END=1256 /DNA_ORIENTATION=+